MYFTLFNKVTDAIILLEDESDIRFDNVSVVIDLLKNAQIECEEIYIGTATDI